MSYLSWNCRGSGGPATIQTLKRYLHSTGAILAFVSETRCHEKRAKRRITELGNYDLEAVSSVGQSGGLWALWRDDLKVTVLEKSFHFIFLRIEDPERPTVVGMIYGDPHHTLNGYIWERVQYYADQPTPVCLIGDFNSILHPHEKHGGSRRFRASNRDFRRMTEEAGMVDLGYQGPAYTWTNGRMGAGLILERLDRAMATIGWTGLFPKAAVYHLPRFNSDHNPILLMTEARPIKRRKAFRIENWWIDYPGFKESCAGILEGGVGSWGETVNALRSGITRWERGVPQPDHELKVIEKEMTMLQQQVPQHMQKEEEMKLQERYNDTLARIEMFWLQRSRLRWNVEGDANTAFFHATTRSRRRRNAITMIQIDDDRWIVEEKQVRTLFINHYKQIYSCGDNSQHRGLTDLDPLTIAALPRVQEGPAEALQRVPSDEEIRLAVFSLGPDKAPGPDGVNARFVQNLWGLLGPTVMGEI